LDILKSTRQGGFFAYWLSNFCGGRSTKIKTATPDDGVLLSANDYQPPVEGATVYFIASMMSKSGFSTIPSRFTSK
jgi:hypothetical protein